jgi:hypothetical protein
MDAMCGRDEKLFQIFQHVEKSQWLTHVENYELLDTCYQ